MTWREASRATVAAIAGAALLGSATALNVQIAIALVAVVLLTLALSFGLDRAFVVLVCLFPVVPSSLRLAGSGLLYPQRILVALLVLFALADRETWAEHRWRLNSLGAPSRAFAVYLMIGLVSAALSPFAQVAAQGVAFYGLQLGGAAFAGCMLARRENADRYYSALSIAVLLVGAISIIQYFDPGILHTILGPVEASGSAAGAVRALARRVSGPLPDPVSLGSYAALVLPFVLRSSVSRERHTALWGTSATAMVLVILMLSQTRMAMIAGVFAAAVWFLASGRVKRLIGVAGVVGVTLVAIFGASVLSTEGNILTSLLAYRGGQASPYSLQQQNLAGRTTIYTTAWRAFQAEPLLGYGMRVPTERAQSATFTQYGNPLAFESYLVVVPLEVGVIGTLVLLSVLALLLRTAHRRFPDRSDRATIYAAFAGAAVLSVGTNAFDIEVTYFWLWIGIVFGLAMQRPDPVSDTRAEMGRNMLFPLPARGTLKSGRIRG